MSAYRASIVFAGAVFAGVAALLAGSDAGQAKTRSGYVIEFRSRPTEHFGHGYVVVGRATENGGIAAVRKAGFMPDSTVPEIKALGRVRGEVTFTDEDRRLAPTQRFRAHVSRGDYERAIARIDGNKRRQPSFGLFEQNCNTFMGTVARAAGLRTPSSDLILPANYVQELSSLNGRRKSRR